MIEELMVQIFWFTLISALDPTAMLRDLGLTCRSFYDIVLRSERLNAAALNFNLQTPSIVNRLLGRCPHQLIDVYISVKAMSGPVDEQRVVNILWIIAQTQVISRVRRIHLNLPARSINVFSHLITLVGMPGTPNIANMEAVSLHSPHGEESKSIDTVWLSYISSPLKSLSVTYSIFFPPIWKLPIQPPQSALPA
jgi:hypothetical protein